MIAAAENRDPLIPKGQIEPFIFKVHRAEPGKVYRYIVEMRPRTGSWSPFGYALRKDEIDTVLPQMIAGPKGNPRVKAWMQQGAHSADLDHPEYGSMAVSGADNPANHENSYYLKCARLPSVLIFGQLFYEPREIHTVTPRA